MVLRLSNQWPVHTMMPLYGEVTGVHSGADAGAYLVMRVNAIANAPLVSIAFDRMRLTQ